MEKHGFYTLKDSFYEFVNDQFLMGNKHGNRPFYYCLEKEYKGVKIMWMIPLSSRIEKYKGIIEYRIQNNKPIDGFYICKLPSGRESAFLIQDMFPITEEYVEREYTLGNKQMILINAKDIRTIDEKVDRVITLICKGIKLVPTAPDVPRIIKMLLGEKVNI